MTESINLYILLFSDSRDFLLQKLSKSNEGYILLARKASRWLSCSDSSLSLSLYSLTRRDFS